VVDLRLPGIDTTSWTWAGSSGQGVGAYYWAATDVLVAVPELGTIQTEEIAQRSLDEFNRLADEAGRRLAVIVLVDRVTSQDSGSRRVWSRPQEKPRRCALALVCASALSRAIGAFFIGLNRPPTPTRMFRDFERALEFCKTVVKEEGGPLTDGVGEPR
jgi:hypothetical protein